MNPSQKSKEFFLKYHAALSGHKKTPELISQFVEDEKLTGHILFFENLFPEYEVIIDDLVAEGEQVFIRSHLVGLHKGAMEGIPATQKTVDAPFALGYRIKNDKIVSFWAIANEMDFFEQLGLAKEQINVPAPDEI